MPPRLSGLAKNALTYALGVVVRNVRVVISYERHMADEARRPAMGPRSVASSRPS